MLTVSGFTHSELSSSLSTLNNLSSTQSHRKGICKDIVKSSVLAISCLRKNIFISKIWNILGSTTVDTTGMKKLFYLLEPVKSLHTVTTICSWGVSNIYNSCLSNIKQWKVKEPGMLQYIVCSVLCPELKLSSRGIYCNRMCLNVSNLIMSRQILPQPL